VHWRVIYSGSSLLEPIVRFVNQLQKLSNVTISHCT